METNNTLNPLQETAIDKKARNYARRLKIKAKEDYLLYSLVIEAYKRGFYNGYKTKSL